jgi:hypothetical protein
LPLAKPVARPSTSAIASPGSIPRARLWWWPR